MIATNEFYFKSLLIRVWVSLATAQPWVNQFVLNALRGTGNHTLRRAQLRNLQTACLLKRR